MAKVLVSNNSELLRHLTSTPFRRLGLELIVGASGDGVLAQARRHHPALAILDAELAGMSGYDVAKQIKQDSPDSKVVLVLGKRIAADQMRLVAESGCDEIMIAPMSSDDLYDVVAIRLGLPRRGNERYSIDLALVGDDGVHAIEGRVTNLSIDGARVVVAEQIPEGTKLRLTITPDGTEAEPIEVDAHVVWSQERDGETVVGASFDHVDEEARSRLSRLTQWDIIEESERTRVVLKGNITEATSFRDLIPAMVGRVAFDLSNVEYMNSLGVREWCNFLKDARIQGFELQACSIPFVLQASLVNDVVGRGVVTSFFAPYHCEQCDHQEDRFLQSAAILASENLDPPVFTCPSCSGEMQLDDVPERYLAFLRGDAPTPARDTLAYDEHDELDEHDEHESG